MLTIQICYLCI